MPAAQAAGRDASPANRGGLNSERGLLRQTTTPNTSPNSSQRQWLIDLAELLREARQRFGDVSWASAAGGPKTYAHKFVLYARAPGEPQASSLCPKDRYVEADRGRTPSRRCIRPGLCRGCDRRSGGSRSTRRCSRLLLYCTARGGSLCCRSRRVSRRGRRRFRCPAEG